MNKRIVLILGGARSGKSSLAQKLASEMGRNVLFVATAEQGDEEMGLRIEAHKKSRPASWRTLEASKNVGAKLARRTGDADVVIIDCLTLLVSNIVGECEDATLDAALERKVQKEIKGLIGCMDNSNASFIIVSNEVGLGLVPPYPAGRVYRDLLGKANQLLAARADEVYLMVAGIPIDLKRLKGYSLQD